MESNNTDLDYRNKVVASTSTEYGQELKIPISEENKTVQQVEHPSGDRDDGNQLEHEAVAAGEVEEDDEATVDTGRPDDMDLIDDEIESDGGMDGIRGTGGGNGGLRQEEEHRSHTSKSLELQAEPRRPARAGAISIKVLLEEGILMPGTGVLSMDYKGDSHTADLLPDGRISVDVAGKTMVFESPSAFSIYLKRLVNPTRKADDGWKSVKYEGKLLEHYKLELARKTLGMDLLESMPTRNAKRAKTSVYVSTPPPSPPSSPRIRRARDDVLGADDADHLVHLNQYESGKQPFELLISPAAEALVDLHSHLCKNEVIGVFIGEIDDTGRKIRVTSALPVLAKSEDITPTSCIEMDKDDLAKKLSQLDDGKEVVGWYHSHPTFSARPSTIDIYNQALLQIDHKRDSWSIQPFVGAVVSPYDREHPSRDIAKISWFHVMIPETIQSLSPEESHFSAQCIPYELQVLSLSDELTADAEAASLQKTVEQLAKLYAPLQDRVNVEGLWRKDENGANITRIKKMVISFEDKLSRGAFCGKLKAFAQSKMEVLIRAVWSVYGNTTGALPKNSFNMTDNTTDMASKHIEPVINNGKEAHSEIAHEMEKNSESHHLNEMRNESQEDDELTE